jgi:hypothetical protein
MLLTPLDYDEIMTNFIVEIRLRRMNNEEQHTMEQPLHEKVWHFH